MLITTSRRLSSKTRNLCKELEEVLPLSFYLPRGKKTLRELIDLAYEKGMERICIVETVEREPRRLSFIKVDLDWEWIGYIDVSVSLRGKKIPPVEEDIELCISGNGKYIRDIACFFNACHGDSYAIIHLENDTINFYRKDINNDLIGPEMKILSLHRYDVNGKKDQNKDIHSKKGYSL